MNNLKNRNSALIFISILLSSLPVLSFMEIQTILIVSIPFLYSLMVISEKIKPPGKRTLVFITLFFTVILTINFRQLFSRDAGVPLLIVMSLLKILEMKTIRDELVACFLSFFILLSMILFSTSFFTTLYMFTSAVFTVSVMGYINSPDRNFFQSLKKSVLISLPSILFAFALFFFFPRIQSSFWGKQSSSRNVSGFAQTISPGSVSSLVKSDNIAFKIKFEENDSMEKYFRGIVFNKFDGISWHPDNPPSRGPRQNNDLNPKKAFIVLYPTYSKHLISPDYPLNFPERGIYLTENSTLYSWFFKINDKKLYEVEYTARNPDFPKPSERHLNLPENSNPKAMELGSKWLSLPPEQRIKNGLDFFRENGFEYTLKPPRYGRNYIDEFLFEQKKGFCEHFASSFAFLMRAAKIPARITGGYLGGEQNTIGGFINVRQSDAHAWCEVWLDSRGWVRIDPTAESEPSRLERNTDEIFSSDYASDRNFFQFTRPLMNIIDAVNFFWDQKIMGYNFSLQNEFFEFLGLGNQTFLKKTALFVFLVSLLLICIYLVFKIRTKLENKKPEELLIFEKFQKKINKTDLLKKHHEGYLEYLQRLENQNFDNKELIRDFINCFVYQRYSDQKSDKNIKAMKNILKRIR